MMDFFPLLPEGVQTFPQWFDHEAQQSLVADLRIRLKPAPFFRPRMPERPGSPAGGVSFSVRMTNMGTLGWVSDLRGARYQTHHPQTSAPWPPIPESLLVLWREVAQIYWQEAGYASLLPEPDCCLVNWYAPEARMGLHRDDGEAARDLPIISLSLGQSATFRIGGPARTAPIRNLRLNSGDVVSFGGPSRLALHGIGRLLKLGGTKGRGTGTDPLQLGGRLNLTLRRVRPV